jgi:hypothetical protein
MRFEVTGPPPARCGEKPSPRSTARCEKPPGHDDFHAGRTQGGYWKFWDSGSGTVLAAFAAGWVRRR